MGKGSDDAPATPSYGAAQADIGRWVDNLEVKTDELNRWWMREYKDLKAQSDSVYAMQFETAQDFASWAKEDRQRYEETFAPVQEQYAQAARDWASPEELARVRGEAVADVATAFDASRENALRELEGYGIDPSSTRHQALDVGVRTQEAIAKAYGANAAARAREMEAMGLQADVSAMGGAMAGQAVTAGQAGAGVGTQAMGQAGTTRATGVSGVGAVNVPYQQMIGQGLGMGADIMTQQYQNELARYQLEEGGKENLGGVGAVAGGVVGGIYGGPAGAAIGSSAGSALGSQIEFADGGEVTRGERAIPDGSRIEGAQNGLFTGDTDGSETSDGINVKLSENEFVIPADVVKRKGTEFFDGLIEKTRGGKGDKKAPGGNKLANGGQPSAQAMPALPGPVAALPPRVRTGSRPVPGAAPGGVPTMMPTATYQFDAALDALMQKYGTGIGAGARAI